MQIHLLVASDLAVCGLDTQGVTPIANLDIPEDLLRHLHWMGLAERTGHLDRRA